MTITTPRHTFTIRHDRRFGRPMFSVWYRRTWYRGATVDARDTFVGAFRRARTAIRIVAFIDS